MVFDFKSAKNSVCLIFFNALLIKLMSALVLLEEILFANLSQLYET